MFGSSLSSHLSNFHLPLGLEEEGLFRLAAGNVRKVRRSIIIIIRLGFFSFIELQAVLEIFTRRRILVALCVGIQDVCRGSPEDPGPEVGLLDLRGPGAGVLLVGLEQVARFPMPLI